MCLFEAAHGTTSPTFGRRPIRRLSKQSRLRRISQSARHDVLIAFRDLETTAATLSITAIWRHIVEPLQRAIVPAAGFLQGLRDITRRFGIVLVLDEIVTGFRLAWGGAQERYGVVPDLACYGKVIGGGYPVSAIVGKRELLQLADPQQKGGALCF
jgi:glutamate-1-semialdehyde 2,1-aminomutase